MIEVKNNRLALIPSAQRGTPPAVNVEDLRQLVPFIIPHFPLSDTIMADEVQGVRAFGTEDQLEAVQTKVDEHLASMGRKHDITLEYLRLGGVKGIVVTRVDPNTGAPLVSIDLFAAFGVARQPVQDWAIGMPGGGWGTGDEATGVSYAGILTQYILDLMRSMANEAGAMPIGGIHGICGSDFFDAFVKHPEVRQTYLAQPEAARLRDPLWMRQVNFRELVLEEYRGRIGATVFVQPNECHFFPVGVPELFLEAYAPADYIETVNTIALPRYAKQEVMPFQKGVMLETQQNVLPICTIPRLLFTAQVVEHVP